jgi:hypothetical protein
MLIKTFDLKGGQKMDKEIFNQNRYFQNLTVQGTDVISYTTKVAIIDHINEQVVRRGWWSPTTSKHINYVASQLDYKVVDLPVGSPLRK